MSKSLAILNGVTLAGCAIFFSERQSILIAALLFLPLLDRHWQWRCFNSWKYTLPVWLVMMSIFTAFIFIDEHYFILALSIIFFTALPEEWFFRCYLLQRLESFKIYPYLANILCSLFFALIHIPVQGIFGLLTFFPSMIFGYVFQRTKNLILVIGLHGLSNLIFIVYIREQMFLFLSR